MTACPKGFQTSAVAAGIKKAGTPDLALIVSDAPAAAAAVFTQNTFAAAPVLLSRQHLEASNHRIRAIIVNSGNANAVTGADGMRAAESSARAVAAALKCNPAEVLVASTGVIGRPLPVEKICDAVPELVSGLDASGVDALARAIMTTDTFPKIAAAEFKGVRIAGVAKGAGMIHPDMATMLSFVLTDAVIDYAELNPALRHEHLRARLRREFDAFLPGEDRRFDRVALGGVLGFQAAEARGEFGGRVEAKIDAFVESVADPLGEMAGHFLELARRILGVIFGIVRTDRHNPDLFILVILPHTGEFLFHMLHIGTMLADEHNEKRFFSGKCVKGNCFP